ncbi:phage minor capsid protein [Eggerthellaceae bacterium 24-137]
MISASEQEGLSEGAVEEYRETERGILGAIARALSESADAGVAVAGIRLSARLGQYLARRSEAHSRAVSSSLGKVFDANAKAGPGYGKDARADAGRRAREAWAAAGPRMGEMERSMRTDANAIYAKHAARAAQDARVMGYERALRKAVVNMAEEGVAAYSYKRKDGTVVRVPVDVGVRRMMHTEATQRLIAQELDIAQRNGRNLVRVSTTANARPSHAAWQGKVYQIKGSGEYPNFHEACHPGDMANGIGGYNCGHRVEIYYPGTDLARKDPLEGTGYTAEEAREIVSRQRRYENGIRKRKRVIEVLEGEGMDASDERRRLRAAEDRLKALVDEHSAVLRRQKSYREGTYRRARAKAGAEGVAHLDRRSEARVERIRSGEAGGYQAALGEWQGRALDDLRNVVNPGKQNKHIPGTREYEAKVKSVRKQGYPAPSRLVISVEEAERLVRENAGRGHATIVHGAWRGREKCMADYVIGYVVGRDGSEQPTRGFTIHYSKGDAHIVPARDEGALFDED